MAHIKRPINKAASAQAYEALYRKHETDPRPNDLFESNGMRKTLNPRAENQETLRNEWMALYKKNGGKIEEDEKKSTKKIDSSVEPCSKPWIIFCVIDDQTDTPVPGVILDVTWPSKKKTTHQTDKEGLVEIRNAESGTYTLSSDLKNAGLETILEVGKRKTQASKPPKLTPWHNEQSQESEADSINSAANCIGIVSEHKVKSGETLDSIAKSYGLDWKSLANFNWGTHHPKRVNYHLYNDVGCRKKSADGYNYQLSDEDAPGILYIPKVWSEDGLASNKVHTIRVNSSPYYFIILENDKGLRIPEADFRVTFSDGSKLTGKLGKNGVYRVEDPPPGEIDIEYTNYDDIEAKSLAISARQAFEDREYDEIIRVLMHSPQMLQHVVVAYDRYCNDYTGKGFVNDVYQETTDPEALDAVEGLLAGAALPTRGKVELVNWDPQQLFEEEWDLETFSPDELIGR